MSGPCKTLRQFLLDVELSPTAEIIIEPTATVDALGRAACPHQWTIAYNVWRNNALAFYLVCLQCRRYDAHALPHGLVKFRLRTGELGLLAELVKPDVAPLELCERCGTPGCELQHWAPRRLFDDAWDWPMGYLCPRCHNRWHATLRQNGLRLGAA